MTKSEFLTELQNAKSAHIKWYEYAKAIAEERETGEENKPCTDDDCPFGKWYYGVGSLLNFMTSFKEIEPLHTKLHKNYKKIYEKYLQPEKHGLFVNSEKEKIRKSLELNSMAMELKDISNSLINKLDEVENKLSAMDEQELAKMIFK